MKFSDILKLAVMIFVALFFLFFLLANSGEIVNAWTFLLMISFASILLILLISCPPPSRPIIFVLVFVVLTCHLQRILMLMIDPTIFQFPLVAALSPETLNPVFIFLMLAVAFSGAGVIFGGNIVKNKSEDAGAQNNDLLYRLRNFIIPLSYFCLGVNFYGTLILREGISAQPSGAYGWVMLLLSPEPFIMFTLCLMENSKNLLKKQEWYWLILYLIGYVALCTIRSSRGAFITVLVSWMMVKLAKDIDFKINIKQIIGVLFLVAFLILFFARFATAIRYSWFEQDFSSASNVFSSIVSSDETMKGSTGISWLSSRMNGLDPLIASLSVFKDISIGQFLSFGDIAKTMINNIVPGDVFDKSSLQLGLGQLVVVFFSSPSSYNLFKSGQILHAGNWGGLFSIAYGYSGWIGGLLLLFVWAAFVSIVFSYLGKSESSAKLYYQALFLNMMIYAVWQAGNIDGITTYYFIYFMQGFLVINFGRILLGLKKSERTT